MTKISFDLLWRWIWLLCVASVLLGLLLMVVPGTGLIRWYDVGILHPFFKGPAPGDALDLYRFLMGVVGAGTTGWAITLTFIAQGPFRRREKWAWWACTGGVVAWIGTELLLCLFWRVPTEALFLLGAAVAFGLPLALSWPHFKNAPHSTS